VRRLGRLPYDLKAADSKLICGCGVHPGGMLAHQPAAPAGQIMTAWNVGFGGQINARKPMDRLVG